MIKKDIGYRILIYIIMIAAIIMPWYTNGKYNQDLLVIIVYLKTVFEDASFWDSFNDNVTLIYVIRKIFPDVSPFTLVYLLHNIAVIFLTFTLKRYLKPIYVCAIMLFCFFTVFCNQFRLAYSLSFGITGFMSYFKNKKKGAFLIFCSLFFHFFVAFFILGIRLIDIYNRSKKSMKIIIMFFIGLFIAAIFYFVSGNARFLLYLQRDESGFISSTFFLVGCAVFLLWKSIDKSKRFFVLFVFMLVLISAPLPNISSRLGEMLFIIMLFLSKDSIKTNWSYLWKGSNLPKLYRFLYFFIGLLFFTYRFVNWVILDKFIRPDILDYL
ncbi:hypothetical protein [Chryseobacterium scophthalmum]|uniref:hypothetical protein n=1 Tax=Chryseobacterium scophthalmum TaxID=59733 RepID=UPI001AEBEEE8|nr:hypothetical protein [Chryseobacterium scophthalmum]